MAEDTTKTNDYMGQGLRGPAWAGFGVLTGGLVLNALSSLARGIQPPPPPPPGQSADAIIAELKAQNFALLQTSPINATIAAQGAQIAQLQATVAALSRPMIPWANVAVPGVLPVSAASTPTATPSNG